MTAGARSRAAPWAAPAVASLAAPSVARSVSPAVAPSIAPSVAPPAAPSVAPSAACSPAPAARATPAVGAACAARAAAGPIGNGLGAAAPGPLDTSALHHLAGYLLAMADVPSRKVFRRHIGQPFHLRETEFVLLVLLLTHAAAGPKQLAQALNLPPPNITQLVDRLQARGLVERRRSSTDGRALQVLLTAAGQALAQQTHAASLHMEDGLMQGLSPGERVLLRELLLKMGRATP